MEEAPSLVSMASSLCLTAPFLSSLFWFCGGISSSNEQTTARFFWRLGCCCCLLAAAEGCSLQGGFRPRKGFWSPAVRARESVKERKKSESAADVERRKKKLTLRRRRRRRLRRRRVFLNRPLRARQSSMAPSQALACLEIARDARVPPLEKFIALRRLQR